jgi:HSP20 family molecular chaperone IbpA
VETIFSRFLSNWERLFPGWLRPSGWDSTAEIVVEGNTLFFKVALPGFAPQDVEVLVVGKQIVVKGKRQTPPENDSGLFSFLPSHSF